MGEGRAPDPATINPDGPWAVQAGRSLLIDPGDRADRFTVLVRDRAGQLTSAFDAVLADAGITVCKIPPGGPRASAFAETFVGTVRREVTDRMPSDNGTYAEHQINTPATTNGDNPNGALQSQPRALTAQPSAGTTNGSNVEPSSAASSTITNAPRRDPGQTSQRVWNSQGLGHYSHRLGPPGLALPAGDGVSG